VWWDPSKLTLNVEGGLGFHQKEMLADDGGASLAAYRAWQAAKASAIEKGSRPEYQVFIASLADDAPPGDGIPVEIVTVARSERRAAGRRFGTLVHNVMRDVPLDADRDAIRKLVDWNTRLLGSPSEERDAAAVTVEAVLAHPLLSRARAAERCHREYPLVLKLDNGRLLEGFIDLAFLENGQWSIVDFKTDTDTLGRRNQYERQLQWYGYALTKLTKLPARAYLLEI
jgi:ATP-dependent exoDNAse (exonuclease V) beta subunit